MGRIELRYTPNHGSTLNVAESQLSASARQWLIGRPVGDGDRLLSDVAPWSTEVNTRQHGVDWRITVENASCKPKSVYPKIVM